MKPVFSKIALAITFSPYCRALLAETKRLVSLFNSSVIFIHAGEKTDESEKKLRQIIEESGFDYNTVIKWGTGDPAKVIISECEKENVDLLIAGAVEKESFVKFYLGSIARKIMRESKCSVLILTEPKPETTVFKNIVALVDYTENGDNVVKKAYEISKLEKSNSLTLLRDFYVPGLAITIWDSESADDTKKAREQYQQEEEEKLKIYASELNIKGSNIKHIALYGKEGWESTNFVRETDADLYLVPAPHRKFKFLDRVFSHDLEYTFEHLPSNLLIYKK